MSGQQSTGTESCMLNSASVKHKSEKYLKYRRKRQLRRKRKLFNKAKNKHMGKKNTHSQPAAPPVLNPINQTMTLATNYWAQSHARAISWQYKHQIAYWKAKAEALHYENKVLHGIIENIYRKPFQNEDPGFSASTGQTYYQHKIATNKQISEHEDTDDENESDNSDIYISEEMLEFLQKSAEHRLSREKQKTEYDNAHLAAPPPKISLDESRKEELKLLYGKSATKIIGLETAVQLSFDNYVDSHKPAFWPNIPLNLNFE